MENENWATGKMGNRKIGQHKMCHRKERQHVCNQGKNGNRKFGQLENGVKVHDKAMTIRPVGRI